MRMGDMDCGEGATLETEGLVKGGLKGSFSMLVAQR